METVREAPGEWLRWPPGGLRTAPLRGGGGNGRSCSGQFCDDLSHLPVLMCVLTSALMVYRMGLEALVESYAFWRPSLRTLTFEDIPGIAKQGTAPQELRS